MFGVLRCEWGSIILVDMFKLQISKHKTQIYEHLFYRVVCVHGLQLYISVGYLCMHTIVQVQHCTCIINHSKQLIAVKKCVFK